MHGLDIFTVGAVLYRRDGSKTQAVVPTEGNLDYTAAPELAVKAVIKGTVEGDGCVKEIYLAEHKATLLGQFISSG